MTCTLTSAGEQRQPGNAGRLAPMLAAVRADPWGEVARDSCYVLNCHRPYGTALLFKRAIANARRDFGSAGKTTSSPIDYQVD